MHTRISKYISTSLLLGILALSLVTLMSARSTGQASAHAMVTLANKTWGPFAHSSNDSGTCGNTWAVDTYNLTFERISPRHYELHWNQGTFVTTSGISPGACDGAAHDGAGSNNGQTIHNGEQGTFHGRLFFTVLGGVYHGSRTCTASQCVGATTTETITKFVHHIYDLGAAPVFGAWCFLYHGGDKDSDPGDLHQQADPTSSCSNGVFGKGYWGDIFGPSDI